MQIDNNSSVPIYEQIYKQLLEYITTGLMHADDKAENLPSAVNYLHQFILILIPLLKPIVF